METRVVVVLVVVMLLLPDFMDCSLPRLLLLINRVNITIIPQYSFTLRHNNNNSTITSFNNIIVTVLL